MSPRATRSLGGSARKGLLCKRPDHLPVRGSLAAGPRLSGRLLFYTPIPWLKLSLCSQEVRFLLADAEYAGDVGVPAGGSPEGVGAAVRRRGSGEFPSNGRRGQTP